MKNTPGNRGVFCLYYAGIFFLLLNKKIIFVFFSDSNFFYLHLDYQIKFFHSALGFLKEIGITVVETKKVKGLMPGITIDKGIILLDRVALLYPGDLLHKGRHLAIIPEEERKWLNNSLISERENAPAEEMMAIAWSYAVCLHLKIEPEFVFHEQGYKGGAQS